jgi:uncharacterized membrane protein YphA (DoxX/SURF4 family)
MSRRWASGGPRSPVTAPPAGSVPPASPVTAPPAGSVPPASPVPPTSAIPETSAVTPISAIPETSAVPPISAVPETSAVPLISAVSLTSSVPPGPSTPQARRPALAGLAGCASAIAAEWAPAAGRILLGVVFAWFGYHELLQPAQWTQYVPVIPESSSLAVILVLAHGWVLFVLAAALIAGIAPRAAAAIASVVMLEIVISLAATGLSDTALRDVGVLGLAACLTGCKNQRLVLRG